MLVQKINQQSNTNYQKSRPMSFNADFPITGVTEPLIRRGLFHQRMEEILDNGSVRTTIASLRGRIKKVITKNPNGSLNILKVRKRQIIEINKPEVVS